jgi:hypothetical protein
MVQYLALNDPESSINRKLTNCEYDDYKSEIYICGLLQKSWQLIFFGQTRYIEESSKYTYERA